MPTTLVSAKIRLATKVKQFRLASGISQEELAFRAGIDRTYTSQIERAVANPSLGIICSLADALECSLSDLLLDGVALG